MQTIEIARRLAALHKTEEARRAYELVLFQGENPTAELEAAVYVFQSGGDHRRAFTGLQRLYNRGFFHDEILPILTQAFYAPNVKLLQTRYEKNCKRLKKYPYLFRKDFPSFEELPVLFYPFDDNGFIPYYPAEDRFGDYVNPKKTIISRNFFKNLDNPILASDVYSQYEMEYLYDNVRKSEDVAKENHVYLHYNDWTIFCSWLQILNLRSVLDQKKIVFLIEDEINLYPIDFKERFGIDYSQYKVKPVDIREITRLIWHTQLSSHNGGDFFNEIFDGHPNLLCLLSVMMDSMEETVENYKKELEKAKQDIAVCLSPVAARLSNMRDRTDKDVFVGVFLGMDEHTASLDPQSRIAPAVFFQPHFHNIVFDLQIDPEGQTALYSEQHEKISASPFFRGFKYIKTFTPMRRFTTSHGATVKFMYNATKQSDANEKEDKVVVTDAVMQRVMNRSFMIDWQDRLYMDSVLVRFEDGKLNPKATFTALAAFLDLPYTQTMTYCSLGKKIDPESLPGNDLGFSTAAVYRTYDEYVNDTERYFIEYFLRDAYEYYGYDFQYYDGQPVDEAKAEELINGFTTIDYYMQESWDRNVRPDVSLTTTDDTPVSVDSISDELKEQISKHHMAEIRKNRLYVVRHLLRGLQFVNRKGQPLHFMKKLEPDPALLEQPLYH